jgi:alkaline phosphatase
MKVAATLLLVTTVLVPFFGASPALAQPEFNAKNIIFMIGDGMGFNDVLIGDYYQYGAAGTQVFESFPVQLATSTYEYEAVTDPYPYPILAPIVSENPAYAVFGYDTTLAWTDFNYVRWTDPSGLGRAYDNNSTDSSSSATAMSTGTKTKDGYVGVDINQIPVPNIVEYAESLGKSTGVVTTMSISHATPAGFSAHVVDRNIFPPIALQQIYSSALDVAFGCGAPDFDYDGVAVAGPYSESQCKYVGGVAAWTDISDGSVTGADANGDGVADNWTVIRTAAEFQAMATGDTPNRVLGLAQVKETLQWYRAPQYSTADAFAVPLTPGLPTLSDMSKAALNVLDNNPDGFFLMIEGGAIDYGGHFNTPGRLVEEIIAFNDAVNSVVTWIEAHGGWNQNLLIVTADHETGYIWGPGSGAPATWNPVVNNGVGVMPGFTFNSDIGGFNWHTNSLVPLYVKGAGSELFNTYADETDTVRGPYIDNTEYVKVEVSAFTDYDVTIDLNRNAWTIISTDNYLDPDASSFDFNVSMVYKYTPEGFLTATFDDLTPVEALYVKTTGVGFAGLVYDPNALPGVSSKDLVEGWNLVSCGSAGDADDILSPLRFADIGGQQGVGLATLVSQGEMNLNTGNWYMDATNWANFDGATMSPFDGYWVYMNADKSFGVLTGATSPK